MRAAWEWRAFWAAETHTEVAELASAAAARLGTGAPGEVVSTDDTYLVLSELVHNLKVRRGRLELKVLSHHVRGGFSLWQDKQVWRFPMDSEAITSLARWLPPGCRPPLARMGSANELILRLAQQEPRLSVVPVRKQRVRLRRGDVRLELSRLELPGGVQLTSACADGYELDAVKEIVQRSQLPEHARAVSYVQLLQEATWWLALTNGFESNEAVA